MLIDIVIDTSVLGEFLAQYFDRNLANRGAGRFVAQNEISGELARRLNQVLDEDDLRDSASQQSIASHAQVVISSFAFVELVRKWDDITKGSVTPTQLFAILDEPPEWLVVDRVDDALIPFFLEVPEDVYVEGTGRCGIEWPDAIHAATAIARGKHGVLATTDRRLCAVPSLQDRIIDCG